MDRPIGRELYTAPFIWVPATKCSVQPQGNKFTCYDTFSVAKIAVAEDEHGRRRIAGIRIMNDKTNQVAFSWKEDYGWHGTTVCTSSAG